MFPVSGREITEHANGQAPDGYLIGLNPSGVYKFRIGPSVPAERLDAGSPIFTRRRAFLDCDEGENAPSAASITTHMWGPRNQAPTSQTHPPCMATMVGEIGYAQRY